MSSQGQFPWNPFIFLPPSCSKKPTSCLSSFNLYQLNEHLLLGSVVLLFTFGVSQGVKFIQHVFPLHKGEKRDLRTWKAVVRRTLFLCRSHLSEFILVQPVRNPNVMIREFRARRSRSSCILAVLGKKLTVTVSFGFGVLLNTVEFHKERPTINLTTTQ